MAAGNIELVVIIGGEVTALQLPFTIGQRVNIDGGDVAGVVTAILWRVASPQCEVCWWNAGTHQCAWFDVSRLTPTEGR